MFRMAKRINTIEVRTIMPKMDCLGNCGKQVKNPPGKNVTGYCAKCLGLAHKC